MQKPEVCGRHFFQKTADCADEIVRSEERQVIDADDSGGQCGWRHARVKRERNESGHGYEAADADLGDFGRFWKFFRPEPPKHDRAGEETYRYNRVERDQPCRGHFFAEENEIGVPFCPDEISVEDLLITNYRHGEHG